MREDDKASIYWSKWLYHLLFLSTLNDAAALLRRAPDTAPDDTIHQKSDRPIEYILSVQMNHTSEKGGSFVSVNYLNDLLNPLCKRNGQSKIEAKQAQLRLH